ncbi:hypothetical protein S245_047804, partial [Arachis hypogaea]
MGVRKWPNRSLCSSRSTPLSSLESLFPSSMSSLQFTLPTTCSLHLPLFLLPSLKVYFDKMMLALETFRLTKELVQQRVKDNVVIVTFGNYAFMDFILTWVKQLTDMEVTNFLVAKVEATTFQYGGTEGKRHQLREAMLFHDPPEYYNPP